MVMKSLVCERVRGHVSVRLDGELSQLERAMMSSHLERCAACREYELEVSAFTRALRATPLEPMGRPVMIQRRRLHAGTRLQMAAAAAIAVAALVGASQALRGQQIDINDTFVPNGAAQIKFQTREQVEREQAILARARPGHPVQLLGAAL
jgi:predicted anti-sigma-YlaC factor YlaD